MFIFKCLHVLLWCTLTLPFFSISRVSNKRGYLVLFFIFQSCLSRSSWRSSERWHVASLKFSYQSRRQKPWRFCCIVWEISACCWTTHESRCFIICPRSILWCLIGSQPYPCFPVQDYYFCYIRAMEEITIWKIKPINWTIKIFIFWLTMTIKLTTETNIKIFNNSKLALLLTDETNCK